MLKEIQDNPFRILGVYSNSAMKDIVANEGKMKAFIKVGRAISYPLDLDSILEPVERNEETVAAAKSKIALPDDKVKHSQFWFIKSTLIDNIAFNYLSKGDLDGAMQTFTKKLCASSLQNLVVCHLLNNNYTGAIMAAANLYDNFLSGFIKSVDEQYAESVDKSNLIGQFVDVLLDSGVNLSFVLDYITNQEWIGIIKKRISKPIVIKLENALETSKKSSGKGGVARYNAGITLMSVVRADLPKLKKVVDSMQYQILADKLADEILQCGIDYFNESKEDNAAASAMPIQSYALSIAVGSLEKDRCEENVKILKQIIDSLPPMQVMAEAKFISNELDKFCKSPDLICDAVNLLKTTKPQLRAIKNKLGSNNSFYLKISTQVVGNALNKLIKEVNETQSKIQSYEDYISQKYSYLGQYASIYHPSRYSKSDYEWILTHNVQVETFKAVVKSAWNAIKLMGKFDMDSEFKNNRYGETRKILKGFCEKLDISTSTWSDIGGWVAFFVVIIICAFWGAFVDGRGFEIGGFLGGAVLGAFIPGSIVLAIFSK